jgi:hypothetical protein
MNQIAYKSIVYDKVISMISYGLIIPNCKAVNIFFIFCSLISLFDSCIYNSYR